MPYHLLHKGVPKLLLVCRWLDRLPLLHFSDHVSAMSRRIVTIIIFILIGCHYQACLDWWTIRLQRPSPCA